jgi:hypothetical protein
VTGALRRQELADYLALRRAMGYRMARPEKLLGQFLDFLQPHGQTRITVAAALDWARLPAGTGTTNWWAYRLSAVRGFATYLHSSTQRTRGRPRRERSGKAQARPAQRPLCGRLENVKKVLTDIITAIITAICPGPLDALHGGFS